MAILLINVVEEPGEDMSLELMKTYNIHSIYIQSIESVSEDLILFNSEMQSNGLNLEARPYHWRCDFGNVPPLDISRDSETGLLKEITIFISKKKVAHNYSYICAYSTTIKGYPCFDTKK